MKLIPLFLLLLTRSFSQELKLEEIMAGPDFVGRAPEDFHWSHDGKSVYFNWNPTGEISSLWKYDVRTAKLDVSTDESPRFYDLANQSQYFVGEGGLRKSTSTGSVLIVPGVVSDFQALASGAFFRIGSACYLVNEGGEIRLIVQFEEEKSQHTSGELEKQQLELFDVLRREDELRKLRNAKRNAASVISYPAGANLTFVGITDDTKHIVFRCDKAISATSTGMPKYITRSGEVELSQERPKVTDVETESQLGFYDLTNDSLAWFKTEQLDGIFTRPAYFAEYGISGNYDTPKKVVFHQPVAGTGGQLLIDIRSSDNKDRWVVVYNAATRSTVLASHQHDEAWIGGPGISEWNEATSVCGWLGSEDIYYQSEQTGYSHLYRYNLISGKEDALTSGEWEIHGARLSKDRSAIYLIANKNHPGVRNGYRLNLKTKELLPLFEGNFGMEWELSPDEKHLILKKSEALHPEQLFITQNDRNSRLKAIQKTETQAFQNLNLKQPEIIKIPTSRNAPLFARIYRPEKANGAAICFVHGAGYLQNAHHYWSYYQREMLFHQLLAKEGFTVIDVDYSGSEGYGRDFRTAIYRNMGTPELGDYLDAKKYLVNNLGIDSNRVGIYGGSYGGFMTLMALFKTKSFSCGAALRSVTDWAHYNQEYTANILNYPTTDPLAYKRSSPIYFANGLSQPLLMLHGMVDDNVQFQDIVRLNQRLIELKKKNYWLSIYPVEGHGFVNTTSWIDEYQRIYDLFHTHLLTPAKN